MSAPQLNIALCLFGQPSEGSLYLADIETLITPPHTRREVAFPPTVNFNFLLTPVGANGETILSVATESFNCKDRLCYGEALYFSYHNTDQKTNNHFKLLLL
jgi:hypothetical protein